ncbi:MAG TPA: hypothetical protein PKM27_02920 [Saprospiraceae bacterium]|nr:hypothetical protein [Saprospiraceae bacterium]HNT18986.1 hypothetical protein [Saprospiraceae bacterium]
MIEEEWDEAVDRFLRGQMDPEESARFADRLKNDPSLQEYLRLNQALHQALRNSPSPFRQTLERINVSSDLRVASKRGWILVVVTAIALSIFAFLGIYLNRKKNSGPEALYLAYMKAPASLSPDLAPDRTGEAQSRSISFQDSVLMETDRLYINGQIDQALQLLQSTQEDLLSDRMLFQTGLLLLIKNQAGETLRVFEKINAYSPGEILWYGALAHLKQGEPSAARSKLELIPAESRWYSQSRELLSRL